MFDVADLPLRWPVEVNYHEAKAYCAWRGPHFRLLAEAEYHALRSPAVNSLFFVVVILLLYISISSSSRS